MNRTGAPQVFIGGNHDLVMEKIGRAALREMFGEGCIYLEDEGASVGGLTVWGSPYSHGPNPNPNSNSNPNPNLSPNPNPRGQQQSCLPVDSGGTNGKGS